MRRRYFWMNPLVLQIINEISIGNARY